MEANKADDVGVPGAEDWDALLWIRIYADVAGVRSANCEKGFVLSPAQGIPERLMFEPGPNCWALLGPITLTVADTELAVDEEGVRKDPEFKRVVRKLSQSVLGWRWFSLFESKEAKNRRVEFESRCWRYIAYAAGLLAFELKLAECSSRIDAAVDKLKQCAPELVTDLGIDSLHRLPGMEGCVVGKKVIVQLNSAMAEPETWTAAVVGEGVLWRKNVGGDSADRAGDAPWHEEDGVLATWTESWAAANVALVQC